MNRDDAEYEELPDVHPHVVASDQVIAAVQDLDRHPDVYLRWPFPDLDTVTGPLGAGGDVWFVAAFSGGGKTTFVTSAIESWRQQGKKIYVMPLETQAKRFRTILACLAKGVHPGDALSGNLRRMPDGEAKRAAVKEELFEQCNTPYVDQVMVSEQEAIDVTGLKRGAQEAMAFGADVVIVDHIDHIEDTGQTNMVQASKAVNHAALRMAKDNNLCFLFTSQLNMDIVRGDHLSKYFPPKLNQLWLPSIKAHVATGIIGLSRKIRDRKPHETDDEYVKAIKRARSGEDEPGEALDHSVMCVNAMKLRHYGSNEGKRLYLNYERGRVTPMSERDKYITTGYPRPA